MQLRVRVWNHSEQPIFRTSLHGTEPEGSIRLSVRPMSYDQPPEDAILPGEYAERHLKNTDNIDAGRLYVTFSDANGREWKHRYTTHKLSKLKYRIIKGLEREETGIVAEPKLD